MLCAICDASRLPPAVSLRQEPRSLPSRAKFFSLWCCRMTPAACQRYDHICRIGWCSPSWHGLVYTYIYLAFLSKQMQSHACLIWIVMTTLWSQMLNKNAWLTSFRDPDGNTAMMIAAGLGEYSFHGQLVDGRSISSMIMSNLQGSPKHTKILPVLPACQIASLPSKLWCTIYLNRTTHGLQLSTEVPTRWSWVMNSSHHSRSTFCWGVLDDQHHYGRQTKLDDRIWEKGNATCICWRDWYLWFDWKLTFQSAMSYNAICGYKSKRLVWSMLG